MGKEGGLWWGKGEGYDEKNGRYWVGIGGELRVRKWEVIGGKRWRV